MAFDVATPTPPPHTSRRVGPLLVAVALAAIVAAAAVGAYIVTRDRTTEPAAAMGQTATLTIHGTLRLDADFHAQQKLGEGCTVITTGYSDVRPGAQVKVTDAAGKVVGLGQLGPGRILRDPVLTNPDGWMGGSCGFGFDVAGVPAGLGTYGLEVANRGVVLYHEVDLDETVELVIK